MLMPPRIRKLAFVAHVTTSVGWLGAVAPFLALALSGQNGSDALEVQSAYVAMEVATRFVIWPLCVRAGWDDFRGGCLGRCDRGGPHSCGGRVCCLEALTALIDWAGTSCSSRSST